MRSNTTLSAKGQVVIPREVRERHSWGPGTEFAVEDQGNAILLRPVGSTRSVEPDELLGCVGYEGPVRSLADMDAAIAKGAKRSR